MPDALIEMPSVGLTQAAAERVAYLRRLEGDTSLMLRLSVSGGGCSGFQYGFDFTSETAEDDHVFEHHGVPLVVDEVSLDLLAGSEVDYVEDLAGAAFVVRNPNATASCGCGSSFAI
ncbi:MAG: iron-sulfur cluster insertion protein ErpA [Alphaproteobacteria bacterium]|nr:iron-sulfur cluster insertion protein ErpA [Alphaproteobacteria bacterium]MCB9930887.1 iron-sulfur cluster insertion protein ErpA [Alphaproteobacteria bacterium]